MGSGTICRSFPCGHEIHSDCVDEWLTTRDASCPVCRADFYCLARPEEKDEKGRKDARNAESTGMNPLKRAQKAFGRFLDGFVAS